MNEWARQSPECRYMENKHAMQHYSKKCFKIHLRFVMPHRAEKLGSQAGDG